MKKSSKTSHFPRPAVFGVDMTDTVSTCRDCGEPIKINNANNPVWIHTADAR